MKEKAGKMEKSEENEKVPMEKSEKAGKINKRTSDLKI